MYYRRLDHNLALLATLAALVFMPVEAFGHAQEGIASGFASGFMHPILGPDHLVAMVAVGLWGAQLGRPAVWVLPITFPAVMAIGALIGILGVPLPLVETGVATSAIVLGVMVATDTRLALWIAAVIVGAFAVFHGYAHGTELPEAVNPLAYGVGFVLATGLLIRWPAGEKAVRVSGGLIGLVGCYFLVNGLMA